MEISSLIRYAFMRKAKVQKGLNKAFLFFTPCEELNGGSVFSKLSGDYDVIQPYVEKID